MAAIVPLADNTKAAGSYREQSTSSVMYHTAPRALRVQWQNSWNRFFKIRIRVWFVYTCVRSVCVLGVYQAANIEISLLSRLVRGGEGITNLPRDARVVKGTARGGRGREPGGKRKAAHRARDSKICPDSYSAREAFLHLFRRTIDYLVHRGTKAPKSEKSRRE